MKHTAYLFALFLLLAGVVQSQTGTQNWPQFRGPNTQGHSAETNLPLKWSATENIAWKTELPGEAWSSPIVWGNHLFVTTATEGGASCRVLALDKAVQASPAISQGQIFIRTERHLFAIGKAKP
jgi:hypothetical protein